MELFSNIIDLWLTIRIHSFAKEWMEKFERRQGTRKSLKPENK